MCGFASRAGAKLRVMNQQAAFSSGAPRMLGVRQVHRGGSTHGGRGRCILLTSLKKRAAAAAGFAAAPHLRRACRAVHAVRPECAARHLRAPRTALASSRDRDLEIALGDHDRREAKTFLETIIKLNILQIAISRGKISADWWNVAWQQPVTRLLALVSIASEARSDVGVRA